MHGAFNDVHNSSKQIVIMVCTSPILVIHIIIMNSIIQFK